VRASAEAMKEKRAAAVNFMFKDFRREDCELKVILSGLVCDEKVRTAELKIVTRKT